MQPKFSVVMICKNEADKIEMVLKSAIALTDDFWVYDSGSTDGTLEILRRYNVRIHQGEWLGFGKTKQIAVSLAKYDWILNIDADEVLEEELQAELKTVSLEPSTAYQIKRKNFLGNKHLKWGEWGVDKYYRLFNRKEVNWNDADIHEELIIPAGYRTKILKGSILHYTMKDTAEYSTKMVEYALLNAKKYYSRGKKAAWVKRYFSPAFSFVKNYFFLLGFLDGWEGLVSARFTAFYTFLKYSRLHELWQEEKHKPIK